MQTRARAGVGLGLCGAALFGVSAPLAKLLLPSAPPLLLSGLLYLGAGLGLLVGALAARVPGERAAAGEREARLRRADLPLLAGVVVLGGILGPLLLLYGLVRTSALSASLLLNLEAPFTILLAVTLFREHLSRREGVAALLIVLGAALLGAGGDAGGPRAGLVGMGAIALACLCWGVDNNLTQRLSLREPIAIVRVKALCAGGFSLGLALLLGQALPRGTVLALSLLLGAVSYGLSLVLSVYAMRYLGAARQAAIFATAPFIGALASIALLGDRPRAVDGAAAVVMIGGVALLLRQDHSHVHTHEEIWHDHAHVHDEHHQHEHEGPVAEPHAHPHRHLPITHEHAHVSDLHHRHRH